jgi:hypothetical protein
VDDGWVVANLVSTGLLFGWTALASAVNLAAGAVLLGAEKTAPSTVVASTCGLATASGAIAGAAAASRHGSVSLSAAAAWGLFTTAFTSGKPRAVRMAASAGGLAITAACAWRTARNRKDLALSLTR